MIRNGRHPGRKAPDEERLNVVHRKQSAEVSHKFNGELLKGGLLALRLLALRWRRDYRFARDGWFRAGSACYPEPYHHSDV